MFTSKQDSYISLCHHQNSVKAKKKQQECKLGGEEEMKCCFLDMVTIIMNL